MKPVRLVQDIVRKKAAAKKSKVKFVAAIRKSPGLKIPFFIWLPILLIETICLVKVVPTTASYQWISRISAALTASVPTENSIPKASPQNVVAAFSTSSAPSVVASDTILDVLPGIQPGLLPMVQESFFKIPSTTPSSKKVVVQQASQPKVIAPTPTVIAAQSLLASTTLEVHERYDGPYGVSLVTDAGTYGKIAWNLTTSVLTIGGSVPTFSVSSLCTPTPGVPTTDAPDQNPIFKIQTSYVCTINLTPNSGSDQRMQSKSFSFTTGRGQLVVTGPTSMDVLLHSDTDLGGFIFRNDNPSPLTITGLDIDVSYTALNISNGPLVLRFEDPTTGASLHDYNLETLAAAPSLPYTYAGTDIHIPLYFTIGAGDQEMLPVTVLGVQRLNITGVNPTISIALRQVTTNQTLNRTVVNNADISWSCVVPVGAYDPNATSGPYATGQACK